MPLPTLLLCSAALLAADKPDPKLADLPAFEGAVTLAHGSFFGYVPPQKGDTIRIDWAALTRKGGKQLDFDMGPERKKQWQAAGGGAARSYVPVPGPFRVEGATRPGTGSDRIEGARLVAANDRGWRVTLDLALQPGRGEAQGVRVWVVQESGGSVQSVALIEGKFAGKPPEPSAAAAPAADKPAPDPKLAELPAFEGAVTLANGSFNTYIPPRQGDTVRIDWADLTTPKKGKVFWLSFDMEPERKRRWESAGGGKDSHPYIGASGPFRVEKVHRFREELDLLKGMRLVAEDEWGRKVTLDVAVGGEAGDESPAVVWIIVEHGTIDGVMRLDGKLVGKLPAPWVTPPRAKDPAFIRR